MKSFKSHIEEARVTPGDLKAQGEGKKAARKGQKYEENPYEKGSSRHLQWSKGHNSARARMLKKESEINDITAQYINENNISLDELENMTEEELNELIGKAIGGAFKLGAKAAVGAARLAGKGAKKLVKNKQGNTRFTQAAKNDAKQAQLDKLKKQRADVVKKKLAQRKNKQLQTAVDRAKEKLAASKTKQKKV